MGNWNTISMTKSHWRVIGMVIIQVNDINLYSGLPNYINTLRPRQNGRHFPDDIFKCIFLDENVWIPIDISLMFVPRGSIYNNPALFQIMAWRRSGDKPLSEPMMVSLQTHISVTRPQWVKTCTFNITKSIGPENIYIWRQTRKKMNSADKPSSALARRLYVSLIQHRKLKWCLYNVCNENIHNTEFVNKTLKICLDRSWKKYQVKWSCFRVNPKHTSRVKVYII